MDRPTGIRFGLRIAAPVLTFLLSYPTLRWVLISYHEWRIGHKLVFVAGEDTVAILLALAALAAFLGVVAIRVR